MFKTPYEQLREARESVLTAKSKLHHVPRPIFGSPRHLRAMEQLTELAEELGEMAKQEKHRQEQREREAAEKKGGA